MVFSSTVFVFQFLPICLAIYFGVWWASRKLLFANLALIALSLAFYLIGSGYLVLLLLFSIVLNFGLGRLIVRTQGPRRKLYLAAGIVANLAILIYFKYAGFILGSIAGAAAAAGVNLPLHTLSIALPVGISFYTFMGISYLVQVYGSRDDAPNVLDFALYLSLFPHLVAGPIVRFSELRDAIVERTVGSEIFFEGVFRFSMGMARKVVIADTLALQADRIFALPPSELTPAIAWTGAVCYAFQIFFDFSGYTDMAIGLAKMLGFNFPENFNQPYTAASVTEFWRRWHMTLTRWFRDYVYIPLGGNRRGGARTYLNLFTVFFLCGLWHGAAWTFVAWGMYHGVLLVIERALKTTVGFSARGLGGIVVTFVLVTFGWVFFRSTTIVGAFAFLGRMLGLGAQTIANHQLADFLTPSTITYLALAAVLAFGPSYFWNRLQDNTRTICFKGAFATLALFLSVAYVSETTFRPFIYFRF